MEVGKIKIESLTTTNCEHSGFICTNCVESSDDDYEAEFAVLQLNIKISNKNIELGIDWFCRSCAEKFDLIDPHDAG